MRVTAKCGLVSPLRPMIIVTGHELFKTPMQVVISGKYQRQLLLTWLLDYRAETVLIVYLPQPQKMAAPWRSQETRKGRYWWTELQYCHREFQCINQKESNILRPRWWTRLNKVETSSNTHWHWYFHDRITRCLAVLRRCTDLQTPLTKLKAAGYLNAGSDQKLRILLLRPYLVCLLTTYITLTRVYGI